MARHLSRSSPEADGKVVELGEQVLAKLPSKKRDGKRKKKFKPRLILGTWVGVTERSGEHKAVTHQGRTIRVRTIKCKPVEDRWNADRVLAIKATPKHPNPADAVAGGSNQLWA